MNKSFSLISDFYTKKRQIETIKLRYIKKTRNKLLQKERQSIKSSFENDYRVFIKKKLDSKVEKLGRNYSISKMAKYCLTKRPYLSKVLHLKAHLDQDKVFLIGEYLELTQQERTLLSLLHSYTRSNIEDRKKILLEKINKKKNKKNHFIESSNLEEKVLEKKYQQSYFLDPICQVLHMLLTIDDYRTDTKRIMKELSLSKEALNNKLDFLIKAKIIEIKHQKIVLTKKQIFLPHDSLFINAYHQLLRNFSWSKKIEIHKDDKNEFTLLFTISDESLNVIRTKYLEFLEQVKSEVMNTGNPTRLCQLNIDLFPLA